MAYALTANLNVLVDATLTNSNDLSVSTDKVFRAYNTALTNGTGDGQGNNMWHDQRTLAASGTEDLDLSGVLVSTVTGAALVFTKIKAILIAAAAANTNNVVVSRAASNGVVLFSATADAVSVLPGGLFMVTAPNAGVVVTAATGDLLTITNSAGTTGVTYDVIILGVAS